MVLSIRVLKIKPLTMAWCNLPIPLLFSTLIPWCLGGKPNLGWLESHRNGDDLMTWGWLMAARVYHIVPMVIWLIHCC